MSVTDRGSMLDFPSSGRSAIAAAPDLAGPTSVLDGLGLYSLDHWRRSFADTPLWLIEGILHNTWTLLYGEPKTGKSRLVCSLVRALLGSSEDWFGHQLRSQVKRVAILSADPGGVREYVDRLSDLDPHQVVIGPPPPVTDPSAWASLAGTLEAQKIGLVVLDNLASWAPRVDWKEFGQTGPAFECLDAVGPTGVPLLAVHHEPRSATTPAGSVAVEGRFRHLLRATRTTLTSYGNQVADATYALTADGDRVVDVRPKAAGHELVMAKQVSRREAFDQEVWEKLNGAPASARATKSAACEWLVKQGTGTRNGAQESLRRLIADGRIDDDGGGRGKHAALTMLSRPGSSADAAPLAA